MGMLVLMTTPATRIFNAELLKGHTFKVTIDTLCSTLQRGVIVLNENGFFLRQSDVGNIILYDIELQRKNFFKFQMTGQKVISVNLKHLQGLLRNVKKKDSLQMFIDSTKKGKFFITIRPEGAKRSMRFETNSIVYQEESNYEITELPDGGYKYPMIIDSSDFQKIKRLTAIGKVIVVTIQRSNYLSFKCDASVVYDSELGFGELSEETENVPESSQKEKNRCKCGKKPSKCYCECEICGEYLCDCECECEKCGSYLSFCVCDETKKKTDEDLGIFTANYYSTILTKLVKLPGLCTQMQFYAPTIKGYPLKIEVTAGQGGHILGNIKIYIKDINQITFEESIRNQHDDEIHQKGTSKTTKKDKI